MNSDTLIVERQSPDNDQILRIYKSSGIGDENGDPRYDTDSVVSFVLNSDYPSQKFNDDFCYKLENDKDASAFKMPVYIYGREGVELVTELRDGIEFVNFTGYAYITNEAAKEHNLTDCPKEEFKALIEEAVADYNLFLKGEVYQYILFDKSDKNELGECALVENSSGFGYLGDDGICAIHTELGTEYWDVVIPVGIESKREQAVDSSSDIAFN